MIVPQYWSEARVQHRAKGRQITVRRFGWSDDSQAAADKIANERAQDALARKLAGEKLPQREPKVPYNGAEGVPIREEVLSRHGDVVITRNSYGAHCLNTPNVLFADVDFEEHPTLALYGGVFAMLLVGAVSTGIIVGRAWLGFALIVLALLSGSTLTNTLFRSFQRFRGGTDRVAMSRVNAFASSHPDWSIRLYRTPAGVRLLVTHRLFDPLEQEVAAFLSAVGADPVYVAMCKNQNCFRARLTAKPWRIGMPDHMKPRPGVWPIRPERRAARESWVQRYEAAAAQYSACRYEATLNAERVDARVRDVVRLHDEQCRAGESQPLA